jgi:hypothetical protein
MRRILLVLATMLAAVLVASGVALAAKAIKIQDSDTLPSLANPYPAEISISGFPENSTVSDVNLELHRFSHSDAGDVDMLLVGQGGQEAIVMSDVGGRANNVT